MRAGGNLLAALSITTFLVPVAVADDGELGTGVGTRGGSAGLFGWNSVADFDADRRTASGSWADFAGAHAVSGFCGAVDTERDGRVRVDQDGARGGVVVAPLPQAGG